MAIDNVVFDNKSVDVYCLYNFEYYVNKLYLF